MPLASASFKRGAIDVVGVEALVGFLLDQLVPGVGDAELAALLRGLAERLAHHVGQIDHADLAAHAGQLHRQCRLVGELDLDLLVVEMIVVEALAEALAGRLARLLAGQGVEQPLHRRLARGLLDRLAAALLFEPHRFLDQVARDLLDVAADIADLGELGRLDLDERRVGELGQPPADLGLAAAGGADHQDVLGRDLVAQVVATRRWRRQRLRSATATARLASRWPTICASSAATTALGVRASFIGNPAASRHAGAGRHL